MEHAVDLTGLAVVVLTALACGMVMAHFRQPALVGYLVAGVLLGPTGLGLVSNRGQIAVLAELGVLLLLFVVGMELSVRTLKYAWRIALPAVGLQIVASVAVMLVVSWGLGYPPAMALLLGFVVALSSTAVAVKLMEETGTLRTRVGRVTVAVLIAQDLAFLPMMIVVRQIGGDGFGFGGVLKILLAAGLLAILIGVLSKRRHVQLPFARIIIGHSDLSPLSGLVYCFGAGAVLGLLGLSPAYGAFLAGLTIGNSAQRKQMLAAVRPIESILVMVFFLSIGLLIDLRFIWANLGEVLVLLAVVTLFKTALNIAILRYLKESWPRAFLGGVLISQLGEFAFLLAATGVAVGAIGPEEYRMVIAVTVLSLCLSPFWLTTARRGQSLLADGRLSLRELSLGALVDIVFDREVSAARRAARRLRPGARIAPSPEGRATEPHPPSRRRMVIALPGLIRDWRWSPGPAAASGSAPAEPLSEPEPELRAGPRTGCTPEPPAPHSAALPAAPFSAIPGDPLAEIGEQVRRAARLLDELQDDGIAGAVDPARRDGGAGA